MYRTGLKKIGKNTIKEVELENIIDDKKLEEQITKIKKKGKSLFAKGAYLEAIKLFKNMVDYLLKIERKKDALFFSRKCDQIKKLMEERKENLKLLNQAKFNKNLIKVIDQYKKLIEISKKLNDIDGLEMYKIKLSEFTKSNKISVPELELKSMVLEEKATHLEKQYLYGAASDLYKKCEVISLLLIQLG
ncbi:MAG: hypothetical protein ACFFDN_12360, partial [Candidatus Hodarchaeota archaeon]